MRIHAGFQRGVGSLWVSRGRVTLGEPAEIDIVQSCLYIEHDKHTVMLGYRSKLTLLGSPMKITKPLIGTPPLAQSKRHTWVQTERSAHEGWAQLVRTNQRAAALLHVLVSQMDSQAAVVASRSTLAQLVGYSEATVKRAIADLKNDRWIEVIQLGGKGGVNAYVVNSRVAWADSRERLPSARFSAVVIARHEEQEHIDKEPLRRIPTLYPGDRQLPTGHGQNPPSQPSIAGLEPDLPAISENENNYTSSNITES